MLVISLLPSSFFPPPFLLSYSYTLYLQVEQQEDQHETNGEGGGEEEPPYPFAECAEELMRDLESLFRAFSFEPYSQSLLHIIEVFSFPSPPSPYHSPFPLPPFPFPTSFSLSSPNDLIGAGTGDTHNRPECKQQCKRHKEKKIYEEGPPPTL